MNHVIPMPKWYALSVFTRQEKAAVDHINSMGIELFFPQRTIRRLWSDRVKSLETPLFPGYLFVKIALNAASRVELTRRKQIIDVVGKKKHHLGNEIATWIPDHEIEGVRRLISQREMSEPIYGLSKGQWVEVVSGPLKGISGAILRLPNGKRQIGINVTLLGRSICADLSIDDIIAAHPDTLALAA